MIDRIKATLVLTAMSVGISLLLQAAAGAQGANSAAGTWVTEKGDARIQISPCGAGICGRVASLKDAIDPNTGKPQTDDKNPNPQLATRPMIGVQLFIDMKPTGPNAWSGRIYNADDGKLYASNVSLLSPTSLKVEGCVGSLCGGETWTKVGR